MANQPSPCKFDLSLTAGASLPTGDARIAGRGIQPYFQAPWSYELDNGWGLSGMFTTFLRPSETIVRELTEVTFSVEKELRTGVSMFVEYVGDYPEVGRNQQLANSGLVWHVDKLHQLDAHFAVGLNNNSPTTIVGVGYSFRIDGLGASR